MIFMFPIVWAAIASVSPLPGTNQVNGFGFGNYSTLYDFGPRFPTFFGTASSSPSRRCSSCTCWSPSWAATLSRSLSFPGKNVIFLATLAIFMVPYATLLIPLYVLHNYLRDWPFFGLDLMWLSLALGLFRCPSPPT